MMYFYILIYGNTCKIFSGERKIIYVPKEFSKNICTTSIHLFLEPIIWIGGYTFYFAEGAAYL